MGKESDNLYNSIFAAIGRANATNNLRPLADLGKTTSESNLFRGLRDIARVNPANNLRSLADLGKTTSQSNDDSGASSIFGGHSLFCPIIPVGAPATPPPAPAKPDMNWIRCFADAMAKKEVLVKDGRVMPTIEDLPIMEGRRVNAAFVYSDLHGFTKLVATQPENKSFVFLHAFVEIASRLTKHYGGQVVDCAGDRVLSVFHRSPGDSSDDPVHDAVTFGLYLQTAFDRAIKPAFARRLGELSVGIGIDYGQAVVGCVGIRGSKKIVFFGDAANNAAKLQEMAGRCETVFSYDVVLRKPWYLESSNGWNLLWETAADGSSILRTNSFFRDDVLIKVR
jgi:class 3 adenylate cyclase